MSKRSNIPFTMEDLRKSPIAHLNSHLFVEGKKAINPDLLKKQVPKVPKYSKYKTHIDECLSKFCEGTSFTLYREFPFHPARKFRFDWSILELKIAFEYEGIFGGGKSGHTTHGGYNKDTFKYNCATELGWKVYRYTATTYKNIETDLAGIKL